MPKRSRSGEVRSPARVVAPTSVKGGRLSLIERAAGPLADHDVELVVLHRRIQHLLDHRAQAMDLVDEQHVARLQIGQQRRQIAGTLEHRARGLAQVDAELGGDDVRQRRLAEPRRPEDQHVIERLAALRARADEDLQLRLDLRLTDVLREAVAAGWPARPPPPRALAVPLMMRSLSRPCDSTPAPRPAGRGGSVPRSNVYRDRPP